MSPLHACLIFMCAALHVVRSFDCMLPKMKQSAESHRHFMPASSSCVLQFMSSVLSTVARGVRFSIVMFTALDVIVVLLLCPHREQCKGAPATPILLVDLVTCSTLGLSPIANWVPQEHQCVTTQWYRQAIYSCLHSITEASLEKETWCACQVS
jgi:hypothetical protein